MAKVFIDTSILPKAFRKLDPSLKLTWFYLWTNCDKAGVWEIDEDLFEFENGIELNLDAFVKAFEDLVELSDEKILLKDFIRIDTGNIRENYNPHKPVLRAIHKNNVKLDPSLNQASFKLVEEDVVVEEEESKGGVVGEPSENNSGVIHLTLLEELREELKQHTQAKEARMRMNDLTDPDHDSLVDFFINREIGKERLKVNRQETIHHFGNWLVTEVKKLKESSNGQQGISQELRRYAANLKD